MNIFHSIILGIVEGITEFLPISSTGHLILTSYILNIINIEATKSFEIVIQLGAIMAVIVLYFKDLVNINTIKKLIIAFIPTGIIGLALYKVLKEYLLDNVFIVIISLFIGGILMIIIEKKYIKENINKDKNINLQNFDIKDISYKKALYLGLWQSIAIIPGVSRSGATIIGGLMMNIKRETIVKFSFLLAMPTMLAATTFDLLKNYKEISNNDFLNISIGFITSFIFALIFIKWLINYIKNNNFIIFGIYRIIISIIFALILFYNF